MQGRETGMIIGCMATYPARAQLFWTSVKTILTQVDMLHIVLNEFAAIPDIPEVPANVRFIIPDRDLKDVGKFLPKVDEDDLVFLADDDILFPPDYVQRSVAAMAGFPSDRRCVFGYHGTRYLPATFQGDVSSAIGAIKHKIHGGKLRKLRTSFFYENALDAPRAVDQLGSGVAMARGRDIPPFSFMNGSQNFVDVRWARWCFENNVDRVCLPREGSWIQTQSTESSIYQSFTRRTPVHVRNEIYGFAGRWKDQTLPLVSP